MTMTETHIIETRTHGRYLTRRGASQRKILIGFHGYGESAELHMAELEKIGVDWTLVAVQALHPFYTKSQEVVASWMTRQDREQAIADNIDYVQRVVDELGTYEKLVFLGFSQGVAMAYRAAAKIGCDGVIALAGDVPPDVETQWSAGVLAGGIAPERRRDAGAPPVLIGRGERDDWYTAEKLNKDLKSLPTAKSCVFDGGHEWYEAFRDASRRFLEAR